MKTDSSGCSGKTKNYFNVITTRGKQKAGRSSVLHSSKTLLVLILFLFSLTITACGSKDSKSNSPEVQPKPSVTMKVSQKGSTEECPNGGISIDTGIDDNGNGILDPDEVDDTQFVCNGTDGKPGAGGGMTTLILITDEVPGDNCADGGKKIETGVDDDGNGELDSDEVDEIHYVCNGEDGADGQNGQDGQDGQDGSDGADGLTALISITDEAPGDNCPNGGIKVDVGLDDDGNGILDPDEVDDTAYVCDGNDAPATLISVSDAGENCTNGGKKVEVGVDDDKSGSLAPEEVDDTWYVCNGQDGADGQDGQNGQDGQDGADGQDGLTSLISITDEGPGSNCSNGGKKIEVGLDGNANGTLDSGEVDATHYVCNGEDGLPDGLSSLVSITEELAGDNCPSGGIKIDVGLDDNRNGTLDSSPDEVDDTAYVCNGVGGGGDGPYSIGGTVNGLGAGDTVTLQNNEGDDLTIPVNGRFTFPAKFDGGMSYNVTISATQPDTLTCTVVYGSGSVPGANVTGVMVFCSVDTYTVGGTVSGLDSGNTVILQNNGSDDLDVTANEGFTFATELAVGSPYNVTVLTHPVAQMCSVTSGIGTISTANIADVTVECIPDIIAPTIDSTFPANGVTDVTLDVTLAATFSEAMAPTTITTDTFTLYDVTTSSNVNGTVTYDDNAKIATFDPDEDLTVGHEYTATITTGATDLAHNALAVDEVWSFTTITPPVNTTSMNKISGCEFIDIGAAATTSDSVTLSISATDDVGVAAYYVTDNSTGVIPVAPTPGDADWIDITPTTEYSADINYSFVNSYTEGDRAFVYVWFKDETGNVSGVASDAIRKNTIIFFDDFEDGWGNWYASNGVWEVGTPTSGPGEAHSGGNLAATILAGNTTETDSYLVSPSIVLPAIGTGEEIHLRFWHWFYFYGSQGRVRISEETDPGVWSDWSELTSYGGNSGEWTYPMVDLSAYAGKKIRIGFLYYDSPWRGTGSGWYFDDIMITTP